uniref:4-hydroxyphenylpyruvate dioxygenase n=1 Tax=Odontella aurita TaxID=265563 RepID=A0A7S4IYZ2_9STRA|mmetsp:Transcript_33621/g.100260  ORF Transcript_33621/g.100260 Transcript_33621/m.100260 type:complete len:490 (+) Transcript_33621:347-1816(+)
MRGDRARRRRTSSRFPPSAVSPTTADDDDDDDGRHALSAEAGTAPGGTSNETRRGEDDPGGSDRRRSRPSGSGGGVRRRRRGASASASASGSADSDDDFDAPNPLPSFDAPAAHDFFRRHGLAARAVGVEVRDATESYESAVANGARGVSEPTFVEACKGIRAMEESDEGGGGEGKADFGGGGAGKAAGGCTVSEVELYGDVVLRFVSFADGGGSNGGGGGATTTPVEEGGPLPPPFLPHLSPHPASSSSTRAYETYGLRRIDHAVGNVPDLTEAADHVRGFTGFHDFAEFTAEDVGTVDSGLNSVVLASDAEDVLLPLNEPTEGRRKSQIQTYLEQNRGPGLQHLALKTDDIFTTIARMRKSYDDLGIGFELMARPSDEYYRELPERLGDRLADAQYRELEELGILADADDEGVLLQVFTKPVGDRPTFFVEIIQRIGCAYKPDDDDDAAKDEEDEVMRERPGCGGFGQGNFRELFKAIEDHEKTLKV